MRYRVAELLDLLASGVSLGPPLSRPMPAVEPGAHELRVHDREGQYMKKAYLEAKSTQELCKLLGLPPSEAERIVIRRNLLLAIKKRMQKKGWTHREAAERSGVGRTVITAIVNGNLDRISTDRLIEISQKLGLHVRLEVA